MRSGAKLRWGRESSLLLLHGGFGYELLWRKSLVAALGGGGATTPATTLHVAEHRQLNQADHKVVQVVVLGDRSALLDACSGFL